MASPVARKFTKEEYLAEERKAEGKNEFFNGDMFAMSSASRRHNLIALNIGAHLHRSLASRPCETYVSDMRVLVHETGLYTYPDVVVSCGQPEFEDEQVDTLLNPTVLFEVLSPSTESSDRGRKFAHYHRVSNLQEIVFVDQEFMRVDHLARQPDGRWLVTTYFHEQDVLQLPCLDLSMPISEIYQRTGATEGFGH